MLVRSVVLAVLSAVCFSILVQADAPAPNKADRPRVGAIRWDAWYGNIPKDVKLPVPKETYPGLEHIAANPSPDPGAETLRSLSPEQYAYRRPFFAEVDATGKLIEMNGNRQEVMDREIGYAAGAGLDYWAFTVYPENCPLSYAFKKYLSSSRRNEIDFCFFLVLGSNYGSFTEDPAMQDYVLRHITEPGYLKVQGNRPVVFAGFFNTKTHTKPLDQLAGGVWKSFCDRVEAKGLGRPYLVVSSNRLERRHELFKRLGGDALGAYGMQDGTREEAPFSELAARCETMFAEAAREGFNIVPLAMAGWDTRPRYLNPVSWIPLDPSIPLETRMRRCYRQGTPEEIAAHVGRTVRMLQDRPNPDGVALTLIYAWNENDEGGWLVPTRGPDGKPDTSRVDALRRVLRH